MRNTPPASVPPVAADIIAIAVMTTTNEGNGFVRRRAYEQSAPGLTTPAGAFRTVRFNVPTTRRTPMNHQKLPVLAAIGSAAFVAQGVTELIHTQGDPLRTGVDYGIEAAFAIG